MTVWLKDKEVGKRFGSTRQWVWEMARTHPKFPQPVKFTPRWTRWSLSEIEAFEDFILKEKNKVKVMDEADQLQLLKQIAGGGYL